jgi:hypothetical protein
MGFLDIRQKRKEAKFVFRNFRETFRENCLFFKDFRENVDENFRKKLLYRNIFADMFMKFI